MGRAKAAQKHKKAEKAKVKLKGHATKFLPKGKNITNTTFKVRKIVLQEQLKTHDESQPLTKKKLNIKEILSRLQHYSSSQRDEGLKGLSEIISQMDMAQLTSHLSTVVDSLARLSLDGDVTVRRHSAQILTLVFSLVPETQLLPFCSIIGSYLSCAMTHIQLGVQEDSLLLLDALLEQAPTLAASSASQLLPCVLDMVSRSRNDQQSSRQLSIQLSSNITSSVWRAKVFGRLQALLIVSLRHLEKRGLQEGNSGNQAHHSSVTIPSNPSKQLRFPLYSSTRSTPVCLEKIFQKSMKSSKQLLSDPVQLRSYVEAIMPLMFDSWMEVNPVSSKKAKSKSEDIGLRLEPALILHCVLEIIDLLWQHLTLWEKENSIHDLTSWFTETFVKDVNRFLVKGFPYAGRVHVAVEDDAEGESQGLKRKRVKANHGNTPESSLFKLASPFFLKEKDDHACTQAIGKCVLQNLTLCHLIVNMIRSPPADVKQKILETLISYLNRWGGGLSNWSEHLLRTLRSVFKRSSAWSCDLDPLLSAVVAKYHRSSVKQSASHQLLAHQLCDILGEISKNHFFTHLQSCDSFNSWIRQLPASLTMSDLTVDKLEMFNNLASQNNTAFLEGLQNAFPSLVDVISNFLTLDWKDRAEIEAGLASLFYWIPSWDVEQISALGRVLLTNEHSTLAKKIMNVLCFRREKFKVLNDVQWLNKALSTSAS